jgi:hypothetical protein
VGSDAPDWDTQPGADLGVRHWRVLEQQADQPLVARGKARNASRRAGWRSATSNSCPAVPACSSERIWASSPYPAASGSPAAGHQVSDHKLSSHSGRFAGAAVGVPAAPVLRGGNVPPPPPLGTSAGRAVLCRCVPQRS